MKFRRTRQLFLPLLAALFLLSGCGGLSVSCSLPVSPGQAQLVLVHVHDDDTLILPDTADLQRQSFEIEPDGAATAYYQLPSMVAAVALSTDAASSALSVAETPPALAALLPQAYSDLVISAPDLDGSFYMADVTDGTRWVNVRFYTSMELTADGILLFSGDTSPLKCTPEIFAQGLAQLDLPALLAALPAE